MERLEISGYLCRDYDGNLTLGTSSGVEKISVVGSIKSFAYTHGHVGEHHRGLGGELIYLDNCNLRIYYTDKECSLEDAMLALDTFLYSGDMKLKVDFCGYSEYTITGIDLDEFTIGGHNLNNEMSDHIGEYCHFIIEIN